MSILLLIHRSQPKPLITTSLVASHEDVLSGSSRVPECRAKVSQRPGGGALPHMGCIGMCRCEGYGFQAGYSRIGYIYQRVWVQNRVSFFRKLISWLKIFSRLGKQLLQDRGILGIYSSIGQQNSAELALVQVKGSRVPAAHPHPEIPKVPPRGQRHTQY